MAKKSEKASEVKHQEMNESYEKLRNELFQYRVDIQSYKRSMNTLWTCVSVVLALLAFFGFNRVEAILDKVEENANNRLAKTDELLAKVDTHYLDSLTTLVEERTQAYEDAISALEKGTRVNNELYKKLISGLPYNKRLDVNIDSYRRIEATNFFDVVFYSSEYTIGQTGACYVVMGDEYVADKNDVFLVEVLPWGRNVLVYYQAYEVHNNYNKFYFKFSIFENCKDYLLSVILIHKEGKNTVGYTMTKPITIK